MTAKATEKIAPIDPERFHRALGIYQAAVTEQKSPPSESSSQGQKQEADDAAGIRGILAVKKEFADI